LAVTLREINFDNWEAVVNLKVDDTQQKFVHPNWYSMLQTLYLPEILYHRAIYNDDEAVGYAAMGQDPDDQTCFISRLMIDAAQQGKGYGRAATVAILDDLRSRYGVDAVILVRVVPDNLAARKLYESLGFQDMREVHHGEMVYRLPQPAR
jgi:diamine N-acetyltransferase